MGVSKYMSLVLRLLALAAAPFLLAAGEFGDAARLLNGEWRGEGYVLRVDSQRAQASFDPQRPFAWQRFLVKEVTEDEVVFTIGAELFEAELDADRLTLTSTSFRGPVTMQRWEDAANVPLRPSAD